MNGCVCVCVWRVCKLRVCWVLVAALFSNPRLLLFLFFHHMNVLYTPHIPSPSMHVVVVVTGGGYMPAASGDVRRCLFERHAGGGGGGGASWAGAVAYC